MRSFPHICQPDAMDCGPVCLMMVAEYYGRHYSLDTLREETFIGREGVSLLGISRAAEKIGMRTVGGKLTYEEMEKKVPFPCIVHWNQNHFVVVYKIRGKKVFVADPGKGLITYTREEFCEHWHSTSTKGENKGIALLMEPTRLFYDKKGESEPERSRLKFLSGYFLPYKRFFLQLVFGLLLGSFLQLVFPFLTQAIVE